MTAGAYQRQVNHTFIGFFCCWWRFLVLRSTKVKLCTWCNSHWTQTVFSRVLVWHTHLSLTSAEAISTSPDLLLYTTVIMPTATLDHHRKNNCQYGSYLAALRVGPTIYFCWNNPSTTVSVQIGFTRAIRKIVMEKKPTLTITLYMT